MFVILTSTDCQVCAWRFLQQIPSVDEIKRSILTRFLSTAEQRINNRKVNEQKVKYSGLNRLKTPANNYFDKSRELYFFPEWERSFPRYDLRVANKDAKLYATLHYVTLLPKNISASYMYITHFSLLCATCPTQLIVLNVIILIKFREE